MALCQHLAFWTGRNAERIDRLYRQSALYRDKWDAKRADSTYGRNTILKCIALCERVYTGRQAPANPDNPAAPAPAPQATPVTTGPSARLLTCEQQQNEHFRGYVYVRNLHRVFDPTDGALLKPEQLKAMKGGYSFMLDQANQNRPTTNAWTAFTENQGFDAPKVHGAVFRPELPAGEIIYIEGHPHINTYVPANVERVHGDITPFLSHVQRLIPDERDRTIFLSYCAAVVQYPGRKFYWAPLLQGVEGNG